MDRYIRDTFTNEWKWVTDEPIRSIAPKPLPRGGLQIISDLEPYQSAITGEVIGGRRQHRDHLRAHGVIEVGNERLPPRKLPQMPDARRDVADAMQMVQAGYRPRPIGTHEE